MTIEVVTPDDLTQAVSQLTQQNTLLQEQLNKYKPVKISDRLASLNVGAKNYDDPSYQQAMAKAQIVLLGFYRNWHGDVAGEKFTSVVQAIKSINPKCLVGQYTILSECSDDRVKNASNLNVIDKLDKENWWLRNALGQKLQWATDYNAWDINISVWAKPDVNGDRYPEWLAKANTDLFFSKVPFDFCYSDNVFKNSRVVKANWKGTGDILSTSVDVAASFRQAEQNYWNKLRSLNPNLMIMGNTDHDCSMPEYTRQLEFALLEKNIGASWSLEVKGWKFMFDRYVSACKNSKSVVFHATGDLTNKQQFLYSLATCLLDNGYFAYSDSVVGYSSTPWFDEYNYELGYPIEPAEEFRGKWYRKYQNGLVVVDPNSKTGQIILNS